MLKRLFLGLATAALFGQGCVILRPSATNQPPTSTKTAVVPLGEPSPEGFVAFRRGFGKLPAPARPPIRNKGYQKFSVTFSAALPIIPPEVTVLRQRLTVPNQTILENLALAQRLPSGVLGRAPVSASLSLGWTDNQNFYWQYDAVENNLTAVYINKSLEAKTVSDLPNDSKLLQTAKAWLDGRGVSTRDWGNPNPGISWEKWWQQMQIKNRCMDQKSLDAIREFTHLSAEDAVLPSLPKRDSVSRCLNPEFPAIQMIRYPKLRDGLPVIDWRGQPIMAAWLYINVKRDRAIYASFELPTELDRSNYPALSSDEVLARLKAGGLNPPPAIETSASSSPATVTFNDLTLALLEYRTDDTLSHANGQRRFFFIPALSARGQIRYMDGTTSSYTTLVPLIKDDEFIRN